MEEGKIYDFSLQNIELFFRVEPSDEDIILEGGDGASVSTSVTAQGNPRPDESFQSYQFRLHEHQSLGWRPELSPAQFMRILSNLTAIRIRGTYFSPGEGFIDAVELETALVNEMIKIHIEEYKNICR